MSLRVTRHLLQTLSGLLQISPRRSYSTSKTTFSLGHKRIGNLRTMSLLENPIFKRVLASPELVSLSSLFRKYEYPLRFAGGPVRDILAGKEPKDLDFATTATPDQMKEMFEKEGVRVINALGEKHGTITARINDKENFEVTTLRIDKVTDGRRAEVEYTKDWQLDANRRDLTINSMFLDLDGTLYDYFKGKEDLENSHVRFVGEARDRIQEDYLRILRYFRFYGRIADNPDRHDAETLKAIAENVAGLKIISGERVWMEWKKILSGNFSGELTMKMIEAGLAEYIGLPITPNLGEFRNIYERSKLSGVSLHPITLMSALLVDEMEMLNLHNRLKLSAFERDLGLFVIANRGIAEPYLQSYQFLIVDTKCKVEDCKQWVQETLKYRGDATMADKIANWEVPKFPVNGHDLMAAGCPKGRLMTVISQKLKDIWKESDFMTSKEELLLGLPKIIEETEISALKDTHEKTTRKRRKS